MSSLTNFVTEFHVISTLQALLLIFIGYLVASVVSRGLDRAFRKKLSPHQAMLVRRVIFYAIFILFVTSAIQQLGFRITALLGATGIITVALGIASQTSMSNIISGIFIIGEKPFEIGDTIKVNDMQGEVIAIDYLSVKIRSTDNMMIRIPNELLVKSPITNVSYFPLRRIDLLFNFNYKTNLEKVKEIFTHLSEKNGSCLAEPKPLFSIISLTDSGINTQYSIWAKKDKFNELKNTIQADIYAAFVKNKIDISVPSTVFNLNANAPIPVKLISDKID